jgi:D-xylose transport system substrate-binding protein
VVSALALVMAACGSSGSRETTSSGGVPRAAKVALLLPESKTARYESQDRPLFQAKLKNLCPDCELLYFNANQNAAEQQNQAESALTNGARVLVLDPVDSASAATIVNKAKARDVPVIAYDRLVTNADLDYYVSFDNEQVGRLQAQALYDKLKATGMLDKGSIVMLDGSPTDNNAALLKKGAHSVFDGKVKIGKEVDTPDWSNDRAQAEMDQAITALGKGNIIGVHAANDSMAGGAIAAMKASGFTTLPPVTGQDADLAAVQRLVSGEQYMTVYKAVRLEAEKAAEIAVALLEGGMVTGVTTSTNNGKEDVPSVVFTPVPVTKDRILDTVVKDGFWTVTQICTAQYIDECRAAGIAQ